MHTNERCHIHVKFMNMHFNRSCIWWDICKHIFEFTFSFSYTVGQPRQDPSLLLYPLLVVEEMKSCLDRSVKDLQVQVNVWKFLDVFFFIHEWNEIICIFNNLLNMNIDFFHINKTFSKEYFFKAF